MDRDRSSIIGGIALLLVGAFLLLRNLGVIQQPADALWSVAFLAGGAAFAAVYLSDRARWWALIPAGTLIGLGVLIGLASAFPGVGERWGGSIFLACIAASFLLIYLLHRAHWWPIIPGGVLLTTAVVAGIAAYGSSGELAGAVMMYGMAATFLVLALMELPGGRMRWPLIPAGILAVLGTFILLESVSGFGTVAALALVIAGVFLLTRGMRSGGSD
ncbi:MAG: hypothetical protein R6X16_11930 [Anaerolineae bacterium]